MKKIWFELVWLSDEKEDKGEIKHNISNNPLAPRFSMTSAMRGLSCSKTTLACSPFALAPRGLTPRPACERRGSLGGHTCAQRTRKEERSGRLVVQAQSQEEKSERSSRDVGTRSEAYSNENLDRLELMEVRKVFNAIPFFFFLLLLLSLSLCACACVSSCFIFYFLWY